MTDDRSHQPSRRALMGGAGLAAAAALASPAGASAQTAPAPAAPPSDPLTAYPKPPFPPQVQPWPGLQSQMNPRPDCGETSYVGRGRLAGRRALLTGADSGIGRAAAIAFAREGADVAISYLPQEEPDAREVVDLIRRAGRKAIALPGDLRDEAFCGKLVSDAVAGLGGLDILVSNAARQKSYDHLEDLTTEDFDWTMKTNVYALFWLVKAALPHLKPGAAITCTTSVNAYSPGENIVDYAMTKGAIKIFVEAMAKQLAPKGIRVNGVAPGPFWTPLQVSGGQPESKLASFGATTPLKRPGQPAELAPVYVTLATSDATYITGQIFGASGGTGVPA